MAAIPGYLAVNSIAILPPDPSVPSLLHHLLADNFSRCFNPACECNLYYFYEQRPAKRYLSHQDDNLAKEMDSYYHYRWYIQPEITRFYTICMYCKRGIRFDMTIDGAMRIKDFHNDITMVLSKDGMTSLLIHPNGRIFQYGERVHVINYDHSQVNNTVRLAKIYYRGIAFTIPNVPQSYLLDQFGLRLSPNDFSEIDKDYVHDIFYNDSQVGQQFALDAFRLFQTMTHQYINGVHIYNIGDVKIVLSDVNLIASRGSGLYRMSLSPFAGSIRFQTPYITITASMETESHFFVVCGKNSIYSDGVTFRILFQKQSIALDSDNNFRFYDLTQTNGIDISSFRNPFTAAPAGQETTGEQRAEASN